MSKVTPLWDEHDTNLDIEECCWPGCSEALNVDRPVPVCGGHLIRIGTVFMDETNERLKDYRPFTNRTREELDAAEQNRLLAAHAQSQVYYMRIGDHVKIGFSTNMRARCSDLRVDTGAVLATEPGSFELEKQRHQEFAAERVGRRENFNPSPRLLAHIEAVKAEHGEPNITTYPKVA